MTSNRCGTVYWLNCQLLFLALKHKHTLHDMHTPKLLCTGNLRAWEQGYESVQTLFFDESAGRTRQIWSGDEINPPRAYFFFGSTFDLVSG